MTARVALIKRVHIVGFAPTWVQAPWDDTEAEFWGMNALHRLATDKPFHRWFQLHDLDQHHAEDADHRVWLQNAKIPIYMWSHHIDKFGAYIPAAVPYPKDEIVNRYGTYLTNTVSWMMAYALYLHDIGMGIEEVGVWGVDMAQDSEYEHQRPSVEYFLGLLVGRGIKVIVPPTSDLLKTSSLYGAEENLLRGKMEARKAELAQRKTQHEQQVQMHQAAALQMQGALDDTEYYLRTWVSTPSAKSEA